MAVLRLKAVHGTCLAAVHSLFTSHAACTFQDFILSWSEFSMLLLLNGLAWLDDCSQAWPSSETNMLTGTHVVIIRALPDCYLLLYILFLTSVCCHIHHLPDDEGCHTSSS